MDAGDVVAAFLGFLMIFYPLIIAFILYFFIDLNTWSILFAYAAIVNIIHVFELNIIFEDVREGED